MKRWTAVADLATSLALVVCAVLLLATVAGLMVTALSRAAPSAASPRPRPSRAYPSFGVQLQGVATTPTTIASPTVPLPPAATTTSTPLERQTPSPTVSSGTPSIAPAYPPPAGTPQPPAVPGTSPLARTPSAGLEARETPTHVSSVEMSATPPVTAPRASSVDERAREPQEELVPAPLPTWLSLIVAVLLLIPTLLWYRSRRGEVDQ